MCLEPGAGPALCAGKRSAVFGSVAWSAICVAPAVLGAVLAATSTADRQQYAVRGFAVALMGPMGLALWPARPRGSATRRCGDLGGRAGHLGDAAHVLGGAAAVDGAADDASGTGPWHTRRGLAFAVCPAARAGRRRGAVCMPAGTIAASAPEPAASRGHRFQPFRRGLVRPGVPERGLVALAGQVVGGRAPRHRQAGPEAA
jgi:hypothetical protein